MPDEPWQDLAIDICGPFPTGESIVVLVDYYSRWVEATVQRTTTTKTITTWLKHVMSTHGIPKSFKSDNGPQFISEEFRRFTEEYGIKHHRVTPYWPQANGQVERINRAFAKAIKTSKVDMRNWKEDLPNFLLNYRSTPHFTTGVTPAELLFGRKLQTKLPAISLKTEGDVKQKAKERDGKIKEQSRVYTDNRRGAKQCDLRRGDKVLVKQAYSGKLSTRFENFPYVVQEKQGNSLVLRSQDGRTIRRNVTLVKKYIQGYQQQIPAPQQNHFPEVDVPLYDAAPQQPQVQPAIQQPPALPANQQNRPQRHVGRPRRFNQDFVYG